MKATEMGRKCCITSTPRHFHADNRISAPALINDNALEESKDSAMMREYLGNVPCLTVSMLVPLANPSRPNRRKKLDLIYDALFESTYSPCLTPEL
jgi:hypothetical protein